MLFHVVYKLTKISAGHTEDAIFLNSALLQIVLYLKL